MAKNDLFDVIQRRKSIRAFADKEISNDDLLKIGEAGRHSPTSVNRQRRQFTIVKNKELISKLAHAVDQRINNKDYDFYDPGALILVSVPGTDQISAIELGLAVQNMWLAATSLDLGMAWTHQINGLSDTPEVRDVLDQLGIPSNHVCLNVMAVGVPAENPTPKTRTEEIHLVE